METISRDRRYRGGIGTQLVAILEASRFILHDWDDADAAVILGSLRPSFDPECSYIAGAILLAHPTGREFSAWWWSQHT